MKHCPVCKSKGKRIDTATIKALLLSSLRHVSEKPYYFCSVADCNVVYFDEDGTQTFVKDQVRERVYQKEPNSEDVLICYCFQYRVVDVHNEGEAVAADIRAGIKEGQCACDWRNPQGDCCLGNVLQILRVD